MDEAAVREKSGDEASLALLARRLGYAALVLGLLALGERLRLELTLPRGLGASEWQRALWSSALLFLAVAYLVQLAVLCRLGWGSARECLVGGTLMFLLPCLPFLNAYDWHTIPGAITSTRAIFFLWLPWAILLQGLVLAILRRQPFALVHWQMAGWACAADYGVSLGLQLAVALLTLPLGFF